MVQWLGAVVPLFLRGAEISAHDADNARPYVSLAAVVKSPIVIYHRRGFRSTGRFSKKPESFSLELFNFNFFGMRLIFLIFFVLVFGINPL